MNPISSASSGLGLEVELQDGEIPPLHGEGQLAGGALIEDLGAVTR